MNICVVIPVYRVNLSHFEEISLAQAVKILGNYSLIIIKPNNLDVSPILKKYPSLQVENFDDSYFKSTLTYNRLMLSEEFYKRFIAFEYMLIYQLDAFVFKDELAEWCQQGYDYIGAPWRIEIDFDSYWKECIWQLKRKIAIWLDLKEERYGKYGPKEIILKRAVGNGGFSLRKISKFLSLIPGNQSKINEYLQKASEHPAYNEDMFWSIEINRYFSKISIPNWKIALKFAVEHLPEKAIRLNGGLPFGCHAWDIYDTDFWKKEIEKFGYRFETEKQ